MNPLIEKKLMDCRISMEEPFNRADNENHVTMEPSNESLDLEYQSTNKYNKLLPYVDELNKEALNLLAEIKGQLGRAVMLRKLDSECIYANFKLQEYMKLYSLRFTKEDHIIFVKLYYDLVTIPNLDTFLLFLFGSTLVLLLRKENLLSPNDLQLPWRPLYDLKKRHTEISKSASEMHCHAYFPISNYIRKIIVKAAIYFPITATREILDELRPKLCPLDASTISIAIQNLEDFLPLQLFPENHSHGFKLWFDEFMKMWEICNNAVVWESSMMCLMAKLSRHNIGYIDWEPHIPLMFTRFIRCLNLPVHYKNMKSSEPHEIETQSIVMWIVSTLGNNSSVQMHLEKYLKTIETYFYQANTGSWVDKLKDLISGLATQFVHRLKLERYAKRTWETPIPDSHKLTDADVDAFVKCMIPVAMTSMFGQSGTSETSTVFRLLATIRPKLVIPDVIERLYLTLDSVTEPHKLTAAMSAVTAVARPLIQGSRNINTGYTFNEGPTHVIPLLISLLPGIDGNDLPKLFRTAHLIAVYATMIPIADCSQASASENLNEEDRLVCEATAQFEDFMLQFFDRVFLLIEASTLDYVSHGNQENDRSEVESLVEMVLCSVCMMLLRRASNDIYLSVLHKLRKFITERVLEMRVSGPFAASLCRSFSRVNGHETLKALMPRLAETVLEFTSHDIDIDENLDNQFLYALMLIASIVDTRGNNLLPYIDTITEILDKTIHLKSCEVNKLVSQILQTLLLSLSSLGVDYNFTHGRKGYNDPKYPYVIDWGQGIDVEEVELNWYVPGEKEIATIQRLFNRYLPPELTKINAFIGSNNLITRQELLTSLRIISAIIDGTRACLPLPEDDEKCPEQEIIPFVGVTGVIKMPNGGNVREELVKILVDLQLKMLKNSEDDTKSLKMLSQIWRPLLLGEYGPDERLKKHPAALDMMKFNLRDELVRKKKHIAESILQRAILQHEIRIDTRSYSLRKCHKSIIKQLFLLSTSTYADVRVNAQEVLYISLNYFPDSYQLLTEALVELLGKDPEANHEAHKSLLYLLIGIQPDSLAVKHDWSFLKRIWPALVMSKPSEKISVIELENILTEHIHSNFLRIAIKLRVPDNCITTASKLWTTSPKPLALQPDKGEISLGIEKMEQRERQNMEDYDEMTERILGAIEAKCHWRQRAIGMGLLRKLSHPDRGYSRRCINYFLNALLHDSLEERKIAIPTMVTILRQLKRKHPKITIEPPESPEVPSPGVRHDNLWLQYNYDNRPLSESQWNEMHYIHKPYVGYYTWPKLLEVYAPASQQPSLSPSRILTDSEKLVDDFFTDPQNIERLIKFNSLEELKGKDKFNQSRFQLYKGLFRNHGIKPLKNFLPHLKVLVTQKQEGSQLCAAEVIAGVIRGAKHWPYEMVLEMWGELLPIIRIAFDNTMTETEVDWQRCFGYSLKRRDPNRHCWLIECLMEEPTSTNATASSLERQRLLIICESLLDNTWRVCELHQRLLKRVEQRLIDDPSQNVRKSLGCLLALIFRADYDRSFDDNLVKPRAKEFMDTVLPKLLKLSDYDFIQLEEKKKDISLLKTVCLWINFYAYISDRGTLPSSMKLLEVLCQLRNVETDDELSFNCTKALATLAQTPALSCNMVEIFEAIENAMKSSSWMARESCLHFIEIFVFYNMSLILSDDKWVERVQSIVMGLLADERVEVREKAGQVLCGLLHCNFILEPEKYLNDFKTKSKLEMKKPEDLRLRHAGVLGLCAFIQAHPYHVPKYVPSIFECLSLRVNDPQPILTTIRQTFGDFKRTHYDDWLVHAQSFTEEQLDILQDLTVSSTHYA